MKKIILAFVLLISYPGYTQLGTYGWFSKSKIPYYKDRDRHFDTYQMKNGKELNGFMPGYYIDKNDQKIEGEVQYNYPFIMERILVFRADGNTTFINPKDIKAYFVDGILRESVTVNVSMVASMKSLETYFMIPEIKGKLNLYYYSDENPTDMESTANLSHWNNYWTAYSAYDRKGETDIQRLTPKTRYIQKSGEPGIGVDTMTFGFPNKMSSLVEDCTSLASKVKAKEKGYKSSDLEKIIEEYNSCSN